MREQCCIRSKQCGNDVGSLCCAKNRRNCDPGGGVRIVSCNITFMQVWHVWDLSIAYPFICLILQIRSRQYKKVQRSTTKEILRRWSHVLKGLSGHEDIATLGISSMLKSLLSVYRYTKCSCNVVKKISHNFIRNLLNHNNFLGGILQPEMALKLEAGPGVLSFNPRLSFPSVATDDRKQ